MTRNVCRWRSYSLYPSDIRLLERFRESMSIPDCSKALRLLVNNPPSLTARYVGPLMGRDRDGRPERSRLHNLSLCGRTLAALHKLREETGLSNISQAIRLVIRSSPQLDASVQA